MGTYDELQDMRDYGVYTEIQVLFAARKGVRSWAVSRSHTLKGHLRAGGSLPLRSAQVTARTHTKGRHRHQSADQPNGPKRGEDGVHRRLLRGCDVLKAFFKAVPTEMIYGHPGRELPSGGRGPPTAPGAQKTKKHLRDWFPSGPVCFIASGRRGLGRTIGMRVAHTASRTWSEIISTRRLLPRI